MTRNEIIHVFHEKKGTGRPESNKNHEAADVAKVARSGPVQECEPVTVLRAAEK